MASFWKVLLVELVGSIRNYLLRFFQMRQNRMSGPLLTYVLTGGVAFPPQPNTTFLSSTAPSCGTKAHGAAFTFRSTRVELREGLVMAPEFRGGTRPF